MFAVLNPAATSICCQSSAEQPWLWRALISSELSFLYFMILLFYGYTLCQIAGLIDVQALGNSNMICEQLEWDDRYQRA